MADNTTIEWTDATVDGNFLVRGRFVPDDDAQPERPSAVRVRR